MSARREGRYLPLEDGVINRPKMRSWYFSDETVFIVYKNRRYHEKVGVVGRLYREHFILILPDGHRARVRYNLIRRIEII